MANANREQRQMCPKGRMWVLLFHRAYAPKDDSFLPGMLVNGQ